MRLIDADALIEKSLEEVKDYEGNNDIKHGYHNCQVLMYDAPTIDVVPVETVCEMFGNEAPCNYGLFGVSVDDFMMSKCGKWCEDNCDKVPYTECWQKFFEAIEKWRKQND